MNQSELKEFGKTLEARQAELTNGIKNRESLAVEASPDELDRIQHANERDYEMNNFELNSKRLHAVREALLRMSAGNFGICIGCEEEISGKRLAAIPWASYCIVCQEAADREQKLAGTDVDSSIDVAA
jgi:DnaK suppressor protein